MSFPIYINSLTVECTELEQKLHRQLGNLKLSEVCKPRPGKTYSDGSEMKPEVTYFHYSPEVMEMLPLLYDIHESHIFGTHWHRQAEGLQNILTLSEVATQIWQPVLKQLQDIKVLLADGLIVFHDVENLFKDLHSRENWKQMIGKELEKILNFRGGDYARMIRLRLEQIVAYYELQQSVALARVVLSLRDVYQLKGDFQAEEQICTLVSFSSNKNLFHLKLCKQKKDL